MMQHSQNTAEIINFVPDVWYFCAFCVCVWDVSTYGSYSPAHGDNPRYPNLEKIPRITGSGCLQSDRSTGVLDWILEQI